jgi:transposase
MLLRPDELTDEEKQTVGMLLRLSPEVARARELALSFVKIIKERRVDDLRGWLISAQRSEVAELSSFANGITAEIGVVRAALVHEWSNSQTEGQAHRLKLVKRQMWAREARLAAGARAVRSLMKVRGRPNENHA